MKKTILVAGLLIAAGCNTTHKVEMTHKVEPIYMTVDINIRVDKQLDKFFEDIETPGTPATQPASSKL